MKNMRQGFTMIELIFVIVIIGILAAVAIPKLAATSDDARASKEIANIQICIREMGSQYTATGAYDASSSPACVSTGNNHCLDNVPGANGVFTIQAGASTESWCPAVQTVATNEGLIGTHNFGGSSVSY